MANILKIDDLIKVPIVESGDFSFAIKEESASYIFNSVKRYSDFTRPKTEVPSQNHAFLTGKNGKKILIRKTGDGEYSLIDRYSLLNLMSIINDSDNILNSKRINLDFLSKIESNQLLPEIQNHKVAFIVPIFNASSAEHILFNYELFKTQIPEKDLFVIELSFDGHFLIPESENFIRIVGGENSVMWQKERLLNIALEKIPKDYTAISWIDADVIFKNDNWIEDLKNKLNSAALIQLFNKANFLSENNFDKDHVFNSVFSKERPFNHCGFAWCARREFIDSVKFFDYNICGCGDAIMFKAMTIDGKKEFEKSLVNENFGYLYKVSKYIQSCRAFPFQITTTHLDTDIDHLFHGKIEERKYYEMVKLPGIDFDPIEQLFINKDGIFEWSDSSLAKKVKERVKCHPNFSNLFI